MRSVVTIATGRYVEFIDQLAAGLEGGRADQLFVLTNDPGMLERRDWKQRVLRVRALPLGHMAWPYPTLWRYHSLGSYKDFFVSETDGLIYMDSDMSVVGPIDELWEESLFAVVHPGHWDPSPISLPHCSDPASRAFVPIEKRHFYVAGGVQGGNASAYLDAVSECREAILTDYRNRVMATWHDESHWNAYVVDKADRIAVLPARYCWPESWAVPDRADLQVPAILALDKDHHRLRGTVPSRQESLRKLARRALRRP